MSGILAAWGHAEDVDRAVPRATHAMAHRGEPRRALQERGALLMALGPAPRADELAATRAAWSVVTAGRALRGELGTAATLAEAAAESGILRALGQLDGEIAALAIDRDRAERWILRDHAGTRPLWIARAGTLTMAATDLAALVRAGVAPARVAIDDVRRYVALGIVPPPRAWFPGVRALAPGTAIRIATDGGETEVRWAPAGAHPAGTWGDARRWRDGLRSAIEVAIRRRSGPGTALLLAGGLRSAVSLAALPAREPPAVYSTTPLEPALAALAAARGIDVQVAGVGDADVEAFLDECPVGQPCADPAVVATWSAARAAWAGGAGALLVEAGADEVLGVALPARASDALPAAARRWVRHARAALGGARDPAHDAAAAAALARGDVYAGEGEALPLAEIEALAAASGDAAEGAVAAWLGEQAWAPEGGVLAAETATAAHGMALETPYRDRGVVRVAREIPLGRWTGGRLPRAWLAADHPGAERVTRRPGAAWDLAGYLRRSPRVEGMAESLEGWIEGDHVRAIAAQHRRGDQDRSARLWRLLVLAAWRARLGGAG